MQTVKQYVKDEAGVVHEITVAAVARPRKNGPDRVRPPKAGDPVKAGYVAPAAAPESAAAAADPA